MKKVILSIFTLCLIIGCSNTETGNFIREDILNKNIPGDSALVFSPGIISRGYHEHGFTLSPDGSHILYVMSDRYSMLYVILEMKKTPEGWSNPEVSSFSGYYSDISPMFSPDGKRLFFSSFRPLNIAGDSSYYQKIWVTKKTSTGWSEPEVLILNEDLSKREINPSVSLKGNLYFQANYEEDWNIYLSEFHEGGYKNPVKLPDAINTDRNDGGPCISPDESHLLFHSNKEGGYGRSDIYISFKDNNGSWKTALNLGEKINSTDSDTMPFLSFQGKYLWFSSFRKYEPFEFKGINYDDLIQLYYTPLNGYGTLYWSGGEIIGQLSNQIN